MPTQCIANLAERGSFVILGEHIVEEANHIHFQREINYYNLRIDNSRRGRIHSL